MVEQDPLTGPEEALADGSLQSVSQPGGANAEPTPVWDGERWVALGPDGAATQWWDGATWHPLPAAGPPSVAWAPEPAVAAPGRGAVFAQVAWRAVVLAVGGGALIGLLVGVGASVVDVGNGEQDLVLALLVFPLVAGLFGLLLSFFAAPAVAGLLCWLAVPYRGARRTRWVAALVSMAIVAPFVLLWAVGVAYNDVTAVLLMTGIGLASLLGAGSGGAFWLVGWYVKRLGPAEPGS